MGEMLYSPLLRQIGDRLWEVEEEVRVELPGTDDVITIRPGFRTDLASVPRILWPLVPPFGRYSMAAVVHDFLYSRGGHESDRCHADWVFYRLMVRLDVRRWRRIAMFLAVRLFGWRAFRYK